MIGGIPIGQILGLGVVAFAIVLGWGFWRGKAGILRLYLLSVVVLGALIIAAAAQLLNLENVIEPANAVAIAFSLAGLASGPSLWQQELRNDLQRARLYLPLSGRDLLTWGAWLKLVGRVGAARAAGGYLALFSLAFVAAALTVRPPGPSSDRTFFVVALAPSGLFAVLSAWYLYRGTRRVVPGA